MKIKDSMDDFVENCYLEKGLTKQTTKNYTDDLKKYCSFLKNSNILCTEQIKKEDLLAYISFLNTINLQTSSIARNISTLRGYHAYLLKEEITNTNLAIDIALPKKQQKLPNILSEKEVNDLLNIKCLHPFDYRNKAMLELMYGSGLRISELVSLSTFDLSFEESLVRVVGKGRKERLVPMNKEAIKALKNYLPYRLSSLKGKRCDYLFINNRGTLLTRQALFKILKKRLKELGLNENISPHTLRHSFATHLLQNGADLRSIQELLGHEDIGTTTIYTHVNNKKVQTDYEKYHPREHEKE